MKSEAFLRGFYTAVVGDVKECPYPWGGYHTYSQQRNDWFDGYLRGIERSFGAACQGYKIANSCKL